MVIISYPQPVTISFGRLTVKEEELSSDSILMVPDPQFTILSNVKIISLSTGTLVLSSCGLVDINIGLISSSFADIV